MTILTTTSFSLKDSGIITYVHATTMSYIEQKRQEINRRGRVLYKSEEVVIIDGGMGADVDSGTCNEIGGADLASITDMAGRVRDIHVHQRCECINDIPNNSPNNKSFSRSHNDLGKGGLRWGT